MDTVIVEQKEFDSIKLTGGQRWYELVDLGR
jgi:hypothetical protein